MSDRNMAAPDLAVLVVNWNGEEFLPSCFEAIDRWKGKLIIELIVFDNGSSDRSLQVVGQWVERLPIRILTSSTNLGYATANNRAWAASQAELCLMLNNDAVIGGPLESAVDYMRVHQNVAACQGRLLSFDGRLVDSVGSLMTRSGFLVHTAIGQPARLRVPSRPVFSVKGAAMFLRSSAVHEIGLFDESAFAYFEESDFCWRARLAGWDVTYCDSLPTVYHVGGGTSNRLPASPIEYHSYKNRLRAILKNASVRTLATMLPFHLGICCLAALGALASGRPTATMNIARALLWNIRMLPLTWKERRMVQALRRRSDEEVFRGVSERMRLSQLMRFGRAYEDGWKRVRAMKNQ